MDNYIVRAWRKDGDRLVLDVEGPWCSMREAERRFHRLVNCGEYVRVKCHKLEDSHMVIVEEWCARS